MEVNKLGESEVKFGIKFDKLWEGQFQLGAFINTENWNSKRELYLYICFVKWNVSIGRFAR